MSRMYEPSPISPVQKVTRIERLQAKDQRPAARTARRALFDTGCSPHRRGVSPFPCIGGMKSIPASPQRKSRRSLRSQKVLTLGPCVETDNATAVRVHHDENATPFDGRLHGFPLFTRP
jgi:hypothetical protein